jgi:hypothetical protein
MKKRIKPIFNDRPLTLLSVLLGLLVIIVTIVMAFFIRPNELNVPVRYSDFGTTNIYNDSWYYMVSFVVFLVAIYGLHTLIASKLAEEVSTNVARLFMLLSFGVIGIGVFWLGSIIGVATLLQ